jgi:tetratricopeptide (TPR) repeat protein
MLRILTVILMLLVFLAPAWTQVPRTEKEARQRWEECKSDADVDAAIRACTDTLAMEPIQTRKSSVWRVQVWEKFLTSDTLAGIHKRRGTLYERKGQHDLALEDFRSATRYLADADTFKLMGDVYLRKDDADGAIESYGQAINLDPKLTLAFVGRSGCFLIKHDLARAQEDMNRAAALDPQLLAKFEDNAKDPEVRALLHRARVATGALPPECDAFCQGLQAVLKARSRGFQEIVGGEPNTVGATPAKVTLPGAETCEITAKRQYRCSFPPQEKEKARQHFNELAKQVENALPAGWGKAEQIANWLYVLKHDPEPDAPIAITFTPDFFTSDFVVDITVK